MKNWLLKKKQKNRKKISRVVLQKNSVKKIPLCKNFVPFHVGLGDEPAVLGRVLVAVVAGNLGEVFDVQGAGYVRVEGAFQAALLEPVPVEALEPPGLADLVDSSPHVSHPLARLQLAQAPHQRLQADTKISERFLR